MLRLLVVTQEGFDELSSEFVSSSEIILELEHSLVSLSKWEAEWEIPFLSTDDKTDEQVIDYIRKMYSGTDFTEDVIQKLTPVHYEKISNYINAKMTATWFNEPKHSVNREIVTAELIYYWMIALGIPFACETWHLNRLLTLIRVCNIKNSPKDQRAPRETAEERRARNALRKKQLGTSG